MPLRAGQPHASPQSRYQARRSPEFRCACAQLTLAVRTRWNRCGERIACVRSSHHFEQRMHIDDGAGHGAHNADPEKAPAPGGKCPVAGMRPGVGFSPQIPQKWAGTRIEPPPSLPTPPAEHPAAIAAASPPLERPRVCQVPGVACFSGESVVGFIGHQKIRECWYFRGGWRLLLSIARPAERPDWRHSLCGAENGRQANRRRQCSS